MAPHDGESSHDIMLRLRNLAHLNVSGKTHNHHLQKVARDERGFRKRRPKLIVAIELTVGAVLLGLSGVLLRRYRRK